LKNPCRVIARPSRVTNTAVTRFGIFFFARGSNFAGLTISSRRASHCFELHPEHRQLLFRQFDRHVMGEYVRIVETVNTFLVNQGLLPNLAYLCIHNHFPTLAEPSASIHPAYPYGLALPGYAYFLLLGSVRDNAAIVWNLIMLVAAGAAVATLDARAVVAVVAQVAGLRQLFECPEVVPCSTQRSWRASAATLR